MAKNVIPTKYMESKNVPRRGLSSSVDDLNKAKKNAVKLPIIYYNLVRRMAAEYSKKLQNKSLFAKLWCHVKQKKNRVIVKSVKQDTR